MRGLLSTQALAITLSLLLTPTLSKNAVKLASPLSESYAQTLLNGLATSGLTLEQASSFGKALKSAPTTVALPQTPCALLTTPPVTMADAFNAQRIHTTFGCNAEAAPTIDYAKVQTYATTVTDNLPNLYYATAVLRKSKKLGDARAQVAANVDRAYEASDKSLVSGAFAVMALVEAGGAKLNKFGGYVKKIDLAGQMAAASEEFDYNRIVIENGDLQASSLVTRAIVQQAKSAQEQLLNESQVLQLANSFLLAEPTNAMETAYQVQALCALNADMTSLQKPVAVGKSGEYPVVTFAMTNVFGKSVESARFSVKVGGYLEDLDASGVADMTKFSLSPGLHSYEVFISGASAYAGVVDGQIYKLHKPNSASVALDQPELLVQRKGSQKWTGSGKSSITTGDKVQVTFQLSGVEAGFQANQAMVRFSADSHEGFALAKFSNGEYRALLDMDKAAASVFSGYSGKWQAEIIVGDSAVSKPIRQIVGSLEISLSGDLESNSISQTIASNFSPEKTIAHIFPEPEKRPAEFVSLVFTALTLAPLLALFALWALVGINLKLLAVDVWTLVFHGAIAGVIGLYAMYWLKFNMFITIRYLSILGLVLLLSGHRLLSNVANRRMGTAYDGKKKD